MSNLTSDINTKCSGYFHVATIDNYMIMWKYDHLTFIFYDFTDAHSNVVSGDRMLDSAFSKLELPTQLSVIDLVNNILIILSCRNMDSIDDVFSIGQYKDVLLACTLCKSTSLILHYHTYWIDLIRVLSTYILFEIEIYHTCHFILFSWIQNMSTILVYIFVIFDNTNIII